MCKEMLVLGLIFYVQGDVGPGISCNTAIMLKRVIWDENFMQYVIISNLGREFHII